MNIQEFIHRFKNHPVLFIGTGISLRYLENSYSWNDLLEKISYDLKEDEEFYLDLKSKCEEDGDYNYSKIAQLLEIEFNTILEKDRNGKFKDINEIFYDGMKRGKNLSRFKIFICEIFLNLDYRDVYKDEIAELKKVRKNIGSIVTTNYDKLIEDIFGFQPLIGNSILLSNPYGSLYKIHGCVTEPSKIIITDDDYKGFEYKYELIRAQLLSLFIHHPIIFIGYSIKDKNIKNILKTIFSYIDINSDEAKKIKENFLLIEYEKDNMNLEISDHDIDIEGYSTISINKIKTDNYIDIYKQLAELQLPISAMDIRKVQSIVKDIYAGGDIKVNITADIDRLNNNEKVLAIGTNKTIRYDFDTVSELIEKYFDIIEEANHQRLALIDKYTINRNQYFPIYGFSRINPDIQTIEEKKQQQKEKIRNAIEKRNRHCENNHDNINAIFDDESIA